MNFRSTIDNDTVAAMPAIRFDGRIVIVDREEHIGSACDDLQRHDLIGFDTETRPSFKAGVSHKVSLLQLSTPTTCYLFRLNRIRLDNRILKILGSKRIMKVGADVAGDIRSLHALRDFKEAGFIDLQHEAPRYGIEEKSLRKLSAITLGMRVSKAQRLSNWEANSLTEQQCEYAATDAWVCIRIHEYLQQHPVIEPPQVDEHLAPAVETASEGFRRAERRASGIGAEDGAKTKRRRRHHRAPEKCSTHSTKSE